MSDIIAPLDAADLLQQGLLGPGETSGSRRIHKRRLNTSSDKENENIPLNITSDSSEAKDAFATIPSLLISYETLTHLGFASATATELWNRWSNWPATGPRPETDVDSRGLQITFIDFITASFENVDDVSKDDDLQWRACLSLVGLDAEAQDEIMDPRFKFIRLSQSCLFWAKDTVEMRYAGLKDIQRASRQRDMELRRMATRPGGVQGRRGTGSRPSSSSVGATSSSTISQGQCSVSGLQQQTTPGISSEVCGSASAVAARSAPGHTVLFKGLDQARINGLLNETGALQRIETLLSSSPSDCSGTRALFYFTPDYEVAQYYAAYAKRRSNCESIVILCLRIPNSAIEGLQAPQIQRLYWPNPGWKQLIWHSRTKKPLPKPLRKYRDALLIIGTTSRKPNSEYHLLDSWEDVGNDCVLRTGPRGDDSPAVQYVFSGEEEGCEFLADNIGAGGIEMFPYPASTLEAWLAANAI